MGHGGLIAGRGTPATLVAALAAALFGCADGNPSREARPAAHDGARVCSVSLVGDELLELIVPPGRIACVSHLADDAETSNVAGRIPASVPRLEARIEPVLAAAPDLVLAAPWNDRGFLDLLSRSGIPSVVLDDASDFEAIRAQLLELGTILGEESRARAVAERMDSRLAELDERLAGISGRPRVLAWSHAVVAGSGTSVHALIERAGGSNAAAEAGIEGHAPITDERLLVLDPDVLLLGYDPGEDARQVLAASPQLARTRAAREGAIVMLPPRVLTTLSPHLVEGAFELAAALHPERVPPGAPGGPGTSP